MICLLDSIEIVERRQEELTNNKIREEKFHVRIMLKDVFGFADNKKKLLMA